MLATAHRAATVDDAASLERLIALLEAVEGPIVMPVHPRTHARLERHQRFIGARVALGKQPRVPRDLGGGVAQEIRRGEAHPGALNLC